MQFLLKTNIVYLCSSQLAKCYFSVQYYLPLSILYLNGVRITAKILKHSIRVMCTYWGVWFPGELCLALPIWVSKPCQNRRVALAPSQQQGRSSPLQPTRCACQLSKHISSCESSLGKARQALPEDPNCCIIIGILGNLEN
jgi:hypothetical protein